LGVDVLPESATIALGQRHSRSNHATPVAGALGPNAPACPYTRVQKSGLLSADFLTGISATAFRGKPGSQIIACLPRPPGRFSLLEAGNSVRMSENRKGLQTGCRDEIAHRIGLRQMSRRRPPVRNL